MGALADAALAAGERGVVGVIPGAEAGGARLRTSD